MNLAIIKYNAGNIQSVLNALERLGLQATVTYNPEKIRAADKVIKELKQPVLGICVGMQLLCSHSEENDTTCLGIVPVEVKKFQNTNLKVPQVGWNTIYNLQSALFKNIANNSYIYNVHSYYAEDSKYTIAQCNYGLEYAAAIQKDNFYGVQFHTEKSAETGDKIIENFLEL